MNTIKEDSANLLYEVFNMKPKYAYTFKRFKVNDYAKVCHFDHKGICEYKDKTIKVGEIVKITHVGYYGCYYVESLKEHIKAIITFRGLEKI